MAEKRKGGRPSKWAEVEPRIEEVRQWAKAGATNREIAAALGLGERTFYDMMGQYPQFSQTITEGRMAGAAEVKTALLNKMISNIRHKMIEEICKKILSNTMKISIKRWQRHA